MIKKTNPRDNGSTPYRNRYVWIMAPRHEVFALLDAAMFATQQPAFEPQDTPLVCLAVKRLTPHILDMLNDETRQAWVNLVWPELCN